MFKVRRERSPGHICAENDENMLEIWKLFCVRDFFVG